jgi:GMP synthase (glutamine-hydrolysing)
VLLQCRDTEDDRQREYDSFLRASGLDASGLRSIDVTHGGLASDPLAGVDAVIIGGSGWSIFEDMPGLPELLRTVDTARERKMPILGVCFGAQLLAGHFGGEVIRDQDRYELGTFTVQTTDDAMMDPVFVDLPDEFLVQQAHRDRITMLPHGAVLLAGSERCPIQAFAIPAARIYAVQFHPERRKEEFENGLRTIPQRNYTPENVATALETLRDSIDSERVITAFIERMAMSR